MLSERPISARRPAESATTAASTASVRSGANAFARSPTTRGPARRQRWPAPGPDRAGSGGVEGDLDAARPSSSACSTLLAGRDQGGPARRERLRDGGRRVVAGQVEQPHPDAGRGERRGRSSKIALTGVRRGRAARRPRRRPRASRRRAARRRTGPSRASGRAAAPYAARRGRRAPRRRRSCGRRRGTRARPGSRASRGRSRAAAPPCRAVVQVSPANRSGEVGHHAGEPAGHLGLVLGEHVDAEDAAGGDQLVRVQAPVQAHRDQRRVQAHARERARRHAVPHAVDQRRHDGDAAGPLRQHVTERSPGRPSTPPSTREYTISDRYGRQRAVGANRPRLPRLAPQPDQRQPTTPGREHDGPTRRHRQRRSVRSRTCRSSTG